MSLISSFSQIGQSFLPKNGTANPLQQGQPGVPDPSGAMSPNGVRATDLIRQAEASLKSVAPGEATAPAGAAADTGLPRLQASDPRFGNLLKDFVDQVEAADRASGDSVRGLLLGESDNLHQTMIKINEASTAFTLMVEVRNKMVEAYQEIMRMQI